MRLTVFSQDRAFKKLLSMADALPQALVCVGPNGVGKRHSIRALFQQMHCESMFDKPCGDCPQCRKIAAGQHPDFIEIKASGEQILVDDLRDLKKMLCFAPMDGDVRFIVIDEAHRLNHASANSILKTLEEPPAHTRFFMTTHERGMLLPTILSRSQFLHYSPLDNETLERLLEEKQIVIPEQLKGLCMDLLGGGIARADTFTDQKVLDFLDQALHELRRPTPSWDGIVRFADALGNDDQKIELMLDVLLWHEHAQALLGVNKGELIQARKHALNAIESVFLRGRLDRNANKKLIALSSGVLAFT